jgi:hypothetical protein
MYGHEEDPESGGEKAAGGGLRERCVDWLLSYDF